MLSWSGKYCILLSGGWWRKLTFAFRKKQFYYVYVATDTTKTILFVGITTSLDKQQERWQHMHNNMFDLTGSKYLCTQLLYSECFNSMSKALKRKKEMEQWKEIKEGISFNASTIANICL